MKTTPDKLNHNLISALIKWQSKGRRSVTVKIEPEASYLFPGDPKGPKVTVWAYDYEMMEGKHVTCAEQLPTEGELAKAKQEQIEQERQELLKKLKNLEVSK